MIKNLKRKSGKKSNQNISENAPNEAIAEGAADSIVLLDDFSIGSNVAGSSVGSSSSSSSMMANTSGGTSSTGDSSTGSVALAKPRYKSPTTTVSCPLGASPRHAQVREMTHIVHFDCLYDSIVGAVGQGVGGVETTVADDSGRSIHSSRVVVVSISPRVASVNLSPSIQDMSLA